MCVCVGEFITVSGYASGGNFVPPNGDGVSLSILSPQLFLIVLKCVTVSFFFLAQTRDNFLE